MLSAAVSRRSKHNAAVRKVADMHDCATTNRLTIEN